MKTVVVHVKKNKYDIYIGRANKSISEKESILHNPFKIDKKKGIDRNESIRLYKEYFNEKIKTDSAFKDEVERCRGKRLGCWCKPEACHGDVIVEYLEG